MNLRFKSFLVAAATTALSVLTVSSAVAQTRGQASLTLTNSDANFCYKHDNLWSLTKTSPGLAAPGTSGTVTWTVTAIKSDGGTSFNVYGGLTITNTGSAPATIGNIVINLQKPNSQKIAGKNVPWVSAAADIADATNGNAATKANIVAAGSQEAQAFNAAFGANNYTVSGAQGTFKETPASGDIVFTNCADDSVFNLVPQPTLPVGQSITLLYKANFNLNALTVAGKTFRVEALVTFGNAGARGGSGATATNIDINGNGLIDSDEANVRTVPSRVTMATVPVLPEECNGTVTVFDGCLSEVTGSVTTSNPVGFDAFTHPDPASTVDVPLPDLPGAVISGNASWIVSVDVDGGKDGGEVCNEATLVGTSDGITLGVLCNGVPVFIQCCTAASFSAESCVIVNGDGGPPDGWHDGDYYTYTKGKYQTSNGSPVADYLQANFSSLFPGGLTIGIADGAGPRHNATWTDVNVFRSWIGGGGPSGALAGDTLNAASTSGGTLAKQAATLTVSIKLSGVMPGDPAGLGGLHLKDTGLTIAGTAIDGLTIQQVLDLANQILGGTTGSGSDFSAMNTLLTNINESFDDGAVHTFAIEHLEP